MIKKLGKRIITIKRTVFFKLYCLIIDVLIFVLRIVFGRSLKSKDPIGSVTKGYQTEEMRVEIINKLDIFGYEATKNVIVSFCGLILVVFSGAYFFGIKPDLISIVFSSNFLSLMAGIVLLTIWDSVVPSLILRLINLLIKWRKNILEDVLQELQAQGRQD